MFDYLSASREYYTTFTENLIVQCKHFNGFLLGPQFQPLQPRTENPICEVELFSQPKIIPLNC